jgi:hypothetical protein
MIPAAATQFGSAPGSSVSTMATPRGGCTATPISMTSSLAVFKASACFCIEDHEPRYPVVSYNRMDKERRVYQARVFDGRILTSDEIERIHKEVLNKPATRSISVRGHFCSPPTRELPLGLASHCRRSIATGRVGRSQTAADFSSPTGSRTVKTDPSLVTVTSPPVIRVRGKSSSILPFDVLLHAPPHLDQTAPDLLKKGNHLVDVRIARQLELRIGGLCDGWTRRTGDG